ncbi:probable metal-nicotianamine transporter YSL6 [Olea europaea subsp. europaea]|uniref:Probable metal-nicotianamine transporter YSL6 n=1 Tax=Olea europaea subsp. europaea TaxID=158383 RepID=A0A8S0Q778_OLEEU|nr:probable metal-nicotianamine transporter YSL6 [Olea europaea subsp. europaea]
MADVRSNSNEDHLNILGKKILYLGVVAKSWGEKLKLEELEVERIVPPSDTIFEAVSVEFTIGLQSNFGESEHKLIGQARAWAETYAFAFYTKIVELKKQLKSVEYENIALEVVASRAAKLETEVAPLQHDLVNAMSGFQGPYIELSEVKKDLESKGKEKELAKLATIEKERDLLVVKDSELEENKTDFKNEMERNENEIRGSETKGKKFTSQNKRVMSEILCVRFLGPFSPVPFRKVMVLNYKQTCPGGIATAMLINSFHANTRAELARKRVRCLERYWMISLSWRCFKWFFSDIGDSCGYDNFPNLGLTLFNNGLTLFNNTFYFDFSPTYFGCGLICPHIVNCLLLIGADISWGFVWPFISQRVGDWYLAELSSNDSKGLYGYKVLIAICLILGDGIYNLMKIIAITFM